MCRRYSSGVVAPIICTSPRPSAGLRMFAASIAPSALPAPMMVCSSSIKRMMSPARRTSRSTDFTRSLKIPAVLRPCEHRRDIQRHYALVFKLCRCLPLRNAHRQAPSATAVLPTPGSPTSTGLFLLRRERICIARRISSVRPTTGSKAPPAARSVRSRLYWSSTRVSARRIVLRAAPSAACCGSRDFRTRP